MNMRIGKVLPAFVAGIGVALGAPKVRDCYDKVKDYYDNNIGSNYKYPLADLRNIAPELHLFDADKDNILDKEEARRYALTFSHNGILTNHDVYLFTYVRQNIHARFIPRHWSPPSNIQTTLQNLEEVQDEILREQIAKTEQSAKK